MRIRPLLLAATVAAVTGCASGPRPNFNAIYPGMTSQQVVQSMQGGPSKTQEYADGSNAWYYGEDQCVLMREDKVVAKKRTEERETMSVVGVAAMRETQKAFCAPPGVAAPKTAQELDTPFGTVRNPGAIVDGVKNKARDVVGSDGAK